MHFCYVDESGDSQPINSPTDNQQPLLVIGAIFIDGLKIKNLTSEFIQLKNKHYPAQFAATQHDWDVLLKEIKGSEIRSDIRTKSVNSPIIKKHFLFLDDTIALLNKYDAKMVARIWIKKFGVPLTDKSIYSMSTQKIGDRFQKYLEGKNAEGMIIADFRDPNRNSYVSHSIFTQKYKLKNNGDAYPKINETATFGVSNNHACLQIADLICSVLIYPIATRTFCAPTINNVHTHASYDEIRKRYKKRLRALQYHCKINNKMAWGITASSNPHSPKKINDLFS